MDTAILAFAMIGDDQSVSWVRQNTPLWKIHTFDRGHIDRTPPFNPKLVLIEQQYAKENLLQDIQQVYPSTCTAIINVSNPLSLLHLVKQPSLRGFFTPMDQRATINKGLLEIAAGGYWFPRAIADSLLDDFKKKSCGENQVRSRLTDKENKVINLVAHGASNQKIATTLNISLHTVKAHLYKSYKKLGIGSRGELMGLLNL